MSFISDISKFFGVSLKTATPTDDQQPLHAAATTFQSGAEALLLEVRNVAEDVLHTLITDKLGAFAGMLEYDAYEAVIKLAQEKQKAIEVANPSALVKTLMDVAATPPGQQTIGQPPL